MCDAERELSAKARLRCRRSFPHLHCDASVAAGAGRIGKENIQLDAWHLQPGENLVVAAHLGQTLRLIARRDGLGEVPAPKEHPCPRSHESEQWAETGELSTQCGICR